MPEPTTTTFPTFWPAPETIPVEFAKYLLDNYCHRHRREDDSATAIIAILERQAVAIEQLVEIANKILDAVAVGPAVSLAFKSNPPEEQP